MSVHSLRILGFVLGGLILVMLGIRFAFGRMLSTGGAPAGAVQKSVRSKDGTVIAFEETGAGPALILVSAALVDRDGTRPLAAELATSYRVMNYDRRGRGRSTNTEPYAVAREIEDVEALVEVAGSPVLLFGSSSGAVLALDAASHLGARVQKVFLYEPPFIVDGSRPAIPETLVEEVRASLAGGNRSEAVGLFFTKAIGIPAGGVVFMRLLMPAWADMTRVAHTAPYDLLVMAGTQSGRPLPADRWAPSTTPVMVAVGSKSEPFFHQGAQALHGVLPAAQYRALDGLDHGAVLLAAKELAAAMRESFGSEPSTSR